MVKYNESESESEDASHASEPRFRVRVCMQRFYCSGDVRARAYVCVSPRRRVRWLQRRLRRLFGLPRLLLLSRGHLLPPQEPLALLQPDDPVEVVPADAEPDEGDDATPRDVVDCADEVPVTTVEEVPVTRRSPSPVHSDDLTETKRQALMMLEQFCTSPATESVARPRRRRVRRRRRVPQGAGTEAGTDADMVAGTNADMDAGTDSGRGADTEAGTDADMVAGTEAGTGADTEAGTDASTGADDEPAPAAPSRGPVPVAMVLRNELQPRAPRVVRPLPDRKSATLHDTSPTEIVMG